MEGLGEHRNFAEKVIIRQAEIRTASKRMRDGSEDYNILASNLSAKTGFTPAQTAIFAVLFLLCVAGLYLSPKLTVIILSLLFSLFYLAVVLFRARVLAGFEKQVSAETDFRDETPEENYVILSALYREQNMIDDLIISLSRLRWQEGKKQVYFICEEHDVETISAINSKILPAGFRLLIVPHGQLRTKPRALNFALNQVYGDYLVIFDAEDRPHPNQLLEARSAFKNGPESLVCLQAPLSIDNSKESLITKLFAIEYATLFRGILPAIAEMNAPMPLGGTSNHFKLSELKNAGGWDAYNVTEDADLGIRLARRGKTCGVIKLPTYEEAPPHLIAWTKQRTRWMKGWMQTLQVHLRKPKQLILEMGSDNFLKFNLILTSVVVSALVHPFFLGAFFWQMNGYFSGNGLSLYDISITGLSVFNLVAGYTTYGFLAVAVLQKHNQRHLKPYIVFLPLYWLLISIAGWRAVFQILVSPHRWEKTTHGSSSRPSIHAKNTFKQGSI